MFSSASTSASSGQLVGVGARRQVIQRDQRVGLAAAEVGLQLDDRVAALALPAAGPRPMRRSCKPWVM